MQEKSQGWNERGIREQLEWQSKEGTAEAHKDWEMDHAKGQKGKSNGRENSWEGK